MAEEKKSQIGTIKDIARVPNLGCQPCSLDSDSFSLCVGKSRVQQITNVEMLLSLGTSDAVAI
jgi:hypothetical protein